MLFSIFWRSVSLQGKAIKYFDHLTGSSIKKQLYLIWKGSAFYDFDHFKNNFIIYILHLQQNKGQNIRTLPLPSFRATPCLLQGDPYSHHCDTYEGRGRPSRRVGVALAYSRVGEGSLYFGNWLCVDAKNILKKYSLSGLGHKMLSLLRWDTIIFYWRISLKLILMLSFLLLLHFQVIVSRPGKA